MPYQPTSPIPYLGTIDSTVDNVFTCIINPRDTITQYVLKVIDINSTTGEPVLTVTENESGLLYSGTSEQIDTTRITENLQLPLQGNYKTDTLREALTGVRKYPEYRQQSINIQHDLDSRIQGLENFQSEIIQRLERMEESSKRADRNKLRDKLMQYHRHYTNPETNPSGTWTRLESEAFWEFAREYEDKGGNGFIHSEVLPDMERLPIVEVERH